MATISDASPSRRSFLSGLTATAALPAWAGAVPTDPDVVVVGAGSAGLAAPPGSRRRAP